MLSIFLDIFVHYVTIPFSDRSIMPRVKQHVLISLILDYYITYILVTETLKINQHRTLLTCIYFHYFLYYLKHEHECFIRYKTRGAAERFISDKARIASVLNSFKNDPFYTHLVTLFTKEF